MRYAVKLFFGAMLAMIMVAPCTAEVADAYKDCFLEQGSTPSPEKRIEACTTVMNNSAEKDGSFKYEAALGNRAIAYLDLNDFENALVDADRLVSLTPWSAIAHNLRAYTYYKLGKPYQALLDADAAIELDPKYAYAWDTRASIFEALSNADYPDVSEKIREQTVTTYREWAVENYRQALKFKPDLQESIDGLKRLHAYPKRPPQGIDPSN